MWVVTIRSPELLYLQSYFWMLLKISALIWIHESSHPLASSGGGKVLATDQMLLSVFYTQSYLSSSVYSNGLQASSNIECCPAITGPVSHLPNAGWSSKLMIEACFIEFPCSRNAECKQLMTLEMSENYLWLTHLTNMKLNHHDLICYATLIGCRNVNTID